MIARLGNVLYWTFSGLAIFALLIPAINRGDWLNSSNALTIWVISGIVAVFLWLIGLVCHYILGGDQGAFWAPVVGVVAVIACLLIALICVAGAPVVGVVAAITWLLIALICVAVPLISAFGVVFLLERLFPLSHVAVHVVFYFVLFAWIVALIVCVILKEWWKQRREPRSKETPLFFLMDNPFNERFCTYTVSIR